jgi:hypothetical protein
MFAVTKLISLLLRAFITANCFTATPINATPKPLYTPYHQRIYVINAKNIVP